MTTFILHGGRVTHESEANTKFFQEIANRLPDGARVLCCYFANPTKIVSAHEHITAHIDAATEKHFIFEIADPDPEIFVEQAGRADALYFHGGTTGLLKDALQPIKNLSQLFQDKLVIGTSAGAHMLSRYYYSVMKSELYVGLGILPIKVISHYADEYKGQLEMLKTHGESLETYALQEGEFIVINK